MCQSLTAAVSGRTSDRSWIVWIRGEKIKGSDEGAPRILDCAGSARVISKALPPSLLTKPTREYLIAFVVPIKAAVDKKFTSFQLSQGKVFMRQQSLIRRSIREGPSGLSYPNG